MSSGQANWGDQIAVEMVGGIPYRMYSERLHRAEDLLGLGVRWGTRPYVIQDDRVLTFDGLRTAVLGKVSELAQAGIKRGDRIFIVGWNSPEWVVNFWACLRIGAVPVLANTWWSAVELAKGLAGLDPALILADATAAAKLPVGSPQGSWHFDPDGAAPAQLPDGSEPRDEEETALVIFTSGTAGEPKAVVLSHRAILARLHMTLHVTRKLPQQIDGAGEDVTLLTGPLFHVGTMQALLRAVVVGDTLVFSKGRYDPADVLDLVERHKVNRWNAVPTMVSRLLDHPGLPGRDVSSLRSISIGGAPVHAELMQRIRTGLPSVRPRIPTGYGLTENGGQATAAAGSEDIATLGSTGRPMPCVELRLLPHPDLPDAEILLRSPTQMSGYYGMTDSPIDAEGWLHTGDLGRLDERGNLWITGRVKDMIIRGGENISPVAVERALMTIPGVSEAAVFGILHADLGEEVMAAVVVTGDLTAQQLKDELRQKVASFSIPSRWHLQREALPTNPTGKVDKGAISARLRADMSQPAAV